MSIATVVTHGYGPGATPSSVALFGYFGGASVVTPSPTADAGHGGKHGHGKKRYKVVAKINGELVDFDSEEQLLEFLAQIKEELPDEAGKTARRLISSGKKVSEAKTKSVEIVEAPQKALLEDRIDEIDKYYWKLVEKTIQFIDSEEEDLIVSMLWEN